MKRMNNEKNMKRTIKTIHNYFKDIIFKQETHKN